MFFVPDAANPNLMAYFDDVDLDASVIAESATMMNTFIEIPTLETKYVFIVNADIMASNFTLAYGSGVYMVETGGQIVQVMLAFIAVLTFLMF